MRKTLRTPRIFSPTYLQLLLFLKKPVPLGDSHAQGVLSWGLHSEWSWGILVARPENKTDVGTDTAKLQPSGPQEPEEKGISRRGPQLPCL